MSINLRTGLDFLLALSVDELNDIANDLLEITEEVQKRGRK
ncbi:MAG: hypothetical protein ACOX81_00615 [Candidatus Heteroscillospira sp.]|jgi:hypothetical protein